MLNAVPEGGALALLITSLATWRVSVLMVREDGPWMLARWIRQAAGIEHDEEGTPVSYPNRMPALALMCLWCTSMWIAGPVLALWFWFPLMVTGIAVAAGAVIIESVIGRLNRD